MLPSKPLTMPMQRSRGRSLPPIRTTDVEPDPEQLPETQTDENSAVTVDDGLVDINTAGLAELQTITGVGPVTAQRIIDYRKTIGRYASVDQLLGVKGIGSKTLEKIRGQVTVR